MHARIFTPLIGMLTSLITFEFWQNILLSFALAFVGGVAAWLARRLCELIAKKIKSNGN